MSENDNNPKDEKTQQELDDLQAMKDADASATIKILKNDFGLSEEAAQRVVEMATEIHEYTNKQKYIDKNMCIAERMLACQLVVGSYMAHIERSSLINFNVVSVVYNIVQASLEEVIQDVDNTISQANEQKNVVLASEQKKKSMSMARMLVAHAANSFVHGEIIDLLKSIENKQEEELQNMDVAGTISKEENEPGDDNEEADNIDPSLN